MQHSADLPYIYTMKVAQRYVTGAVGINYYHAFLLSSLSEKDEL